MKSVARFVGLDYHEDTVRVCILNEAGDTLVNCNCRNDIEEVGELIWTFGNPAGVALEACGGSAAFAHELQARYQWRVRLAHPGYVNRMKQSPDKSDHDDAELLADLLRVDYLPEVWLPPLEVLELRRVVRYRQGQTAERKNIKQRIGALLREERVPKPACNPWTKAWFQWLKEEAQLSEQARWVMDRLLEDLAHIEERIADTEERMRAITEHDPTTQALLQQKGIGLVTAVTLRAEIGDFRRFRSGKQLARFCTVTPLNSSSGKRQVEGGLVRQGNRELRRVVLEAAQRLARYEPKWKDLKEKMKRRGKPGAVAVAAVANRWVRWLFHQMQETPALAA